MQFTHLPFRAPSEAYREQARQLLGAWNSAVPEAIHLFQHHHPGLLDAKIPWLPKRISEAELRKISFDIPDAELAIARWHCFADWPALQEYIEAVSDDSSPAFRFESAVEALINGDLTSLKHWLASDPALVHARSNRRTPQDPPRHRATLLHYVAANGVEGYRQKTPPNALELARCLLSSSAEPNALADMYGGQCTTMSMLVSSCHPAQAGLQVPLVHLLIDYGAAVEAQGSGNWTSPLMTALAFGYLEAAKALVSRGARVVTLPAAAGLGRIDDSRQLLSGSTPEDRHRALALATLNGHAQTVELLLDYGEDPNRFNPEGHHAHSTPLHQAVCAGHLAIVQLLVARGANLEIRDKIWDATPLGWAEHCRQLEIADYLRAQKTAHSTSQT